MFWLGPFEYKSKKELLDRLKDHLQNAPIGMVTNKLAVKKMHLLIAMHPQASRKIGVGIDHFKIVRNALGAGRGIKLVRTDGSEDGFSYKRGITGVIQSPHGKACEELRFAVRSQLIAFRDALGVPVSCAVSGAIIKDREAFPSRAVGFPLFEFVENLARNIRLFRRLTRVDCRVENIGVRVAFAVISKCGRGAFLEAS